MFNNKKQKMFVLPGSIETIESRAIGGFSGLEHLYYCGSKQLNSNVFDDFGTYRLPDSFEIHVTSKFKYSDLGGRPVTETSYSGIYCPTKAPIKTCLKNRSKMRPCILLMALFLI